ncbi:hypothetical protein A3A49_00745 [Candidatus Curtissbacteria bacterium RIFCSPLOWO2_01_FULL_38_11b]|uniref:Uncharacterized protein n=1 Tax=Candidatus Curtissbacteria bacterium RIFCSPLOWO2_01_FULL_38_11b TaxID=1797725 RepID=A0A1F5H1L1_9BACT|nr:MAG: hypothetical protein A3A49_00745 [Candidatus Curtissbacteria bacterium RIFCSPLOWO2_01_FULL_38_11b]
MAEGATTPEGETSNKISESSKQEVTLVDSTGSANAQVEKKGLLGTVLSLLGRKKQESPQPEETPEQIRDRVATLQAERLNLVRLTGVSDSEGTSKEKDAARIKEIDERIMQLRSKLPPEVSQAQPQDASITAAIPEKDQEAA